MSSKPASAIDPYVARYGVPTDLPRAPNAVIDSLLVHRTVRAYLPDPLPDGTIELLVAAAQSASTSSNLQTWSVVAVKDQARKAMLAKVCNDQKHIEECPVVLLWLADLGRLHRVGAARGEKMESFRYLEMFLVAAIDAAIAAQNAVVAAESMGLGIVYLGAMRNQPEEVAAELGLPPATHAVFGLCVGYPDPARPASVKPRLAMSSILHHERYDASNEARAVAEYDEIMRRFQASQQMPEVGWSAPSVDRMRAVAGLRGREKLRAQLRDLGFPLD